MTEEELNEEIVELNSVIYDTQEQLSNLRTSAEEVIWYLRNSGKIDPLTGEINGTVPLFELRRFFDLMGINL